MVLRPEKEAEARGVFDKWDLDFAIVGETIPEDRFVVMLGGAVKADLPLKALSGTAPEYDRPWVATPAPAPLAAVPKIDPAEALLRLIGSPNYCGRAWVWRQYDQQVMGDTAVVPGSDAGVGTHGRSYSGAVPDSAFSGKSAFTSPPSMTTKRSSGIVSPTMAKSRSHLSKTALASASFSGRSTISIRSWLSESIIS